jgi:hypothetical protein
MEALGGINEIYNFYVGTTLQNAYNTASAAFYSRLSYAYGVDYTSQAAINSIVGISQATANAYIQRGTNAALSVGSSWGCSPGALTNQAVATFASDVNATKNSVNAQISSVKANKQTQHNAWVEEQARLVALAQILEAMTPAARLALLTSEAGVFVNGVHINIGFYYDENTGKPYLSLDNVKYRSELFEFSVEDWNTLAESAYEYAMEREPAAFSDRTAQGISYEFSDHYYGYLLLGDVAFDVRIFDVHVSVDIGEHFKQADVGGLRYDSDAFLWEVLKLRVFGRPPDERP